MPLPHWLTRVNLAVTNRLTLPLAGRLPWFGVLEHVGRRSGAVRRTPLNVFRAAPGRWVIALTYGPGVQWLRNVEARGACRMLIRGRWVRLQEPRRFRDPSRRRVPWIVRRALALLRVDWFVELREADGPVGVEDGRGVLIREHQSRSSTQRRPRTRCASPAERGEPRWQRARTRGRASRVSYATPVRA